MSAFPSYDKLLAELHYEATWAIFMAKFNAFETAVLGLKYSPNQPRAPKGTAEGGQWIVDPNSARQRRRAEDERVLVADSGVDALAGLLNGEPIYDDRPFWVQAKDAVLEGIANVADYVMQAQEQDPEGFERAMRALDALDPTFWGYVIVSQMGDERQKADFQRRVSEYEAGLSEYAGNLKSTLGSWVNQVKSGEMNEELALVLAAGAIALIAKKAPRAVREKALKLAAPALKEIIRLNAVARKQALVAVVKVQNKNISWAKVVDIDKLPNGRIVWLEKGTKQSGLRHIVENHERDFAARGLKLEEIPDLIFHALKQDNVVGAVGSGINKRPVYEVVFNKKLQRVAIGIGSNGYIVTAHPY